MPKCVKFQKFCKLENVPDLQGNCAVDQVNLFDQSSLNGWWPLYATEKETGIKKQCVSAVQCKCILRLTIL